MPPCRTSVRFERGRASAGARSAPAGESARSRSIAARTAKSEQPVRIPAQGLVWRLCRLSQEDSGPRRSAIVSGIAAGAAHRGAMPLYRGLQQRDWRRTSPPAGIRPRMLAVYPSGLRSPQRSARPASRRGRRGRQDDRSPRAGEPLEIRGLEAVAEDQPVHRPAE